MSKVRTALALVADRLHECTHSFDFCLTRDVIEKARPSIPWRTRIFRRDTGRYKIVDPCVRLGVLWPSEYETVGRCVDNRLTTYSSVPDLWRHCLYHRIACFLVRGDCQATPCATWRAESDLCPSRHVENLDHCWSTTLTGIYMLRECCSVFGVFPEEQFSRRNGATG